MRCVSIVAFVVIWSSLPGGCGQGEGDEADVATTITEVDPKYATAESLIETFNSFTTRKPADAARALDLFYPENETQRQYLSIARSMVPMAEWDWLMFERFGEGANPSAKRPLLSPDLPAAITKREEQRAQARYKDQDGEEQTLYLVQINSRWWISGFTLEYDKSWQQMIADAQRMEESMKKFADASKPVIVRLKNDEFKTAQDARKAMGQALAAAVPFT
jgi:hypothetical protein